MATAWLEFTMTVLILGADLAAIILAVCLAALIRGRLDALLIVVNFWLLTELLATLADPAYAFGALLLPRLFASVLQIGAGYALVYGWRRWRFVSESVAAH